MKSLLNRKLPTIFVVASVCFVFLREVRADGINVGLVVVGGLVVLVPLMVFEVFVEAIILAIGLKAQYRKVIPLSFAANLASLAAGLPVNALNEWMYAEFLPHQLASHFREFPRAALLGTAIYFTVTVVVELFIVIRWCRKQATNVTLRRAATVVVLANAATYSVLIPLYFSMSKPLCDIREFTDDSRWALHPLTKLFYVERNTGNLCSITTDGRLNQILVPDRVQDYQFPFDCAWFLYRNNSNCLCILRDNGKPQVCWQAEQQFAMEQVACNPDGTVVAYLDSGPDRKLFELVLCSPGSSRHRTGIKVRQYGYGPEPEIAWSNEPGILFLQNMVEMTALHIGKDLSAVTVPIESVGKKLMAVYGRSRNLTDWRGDLNGSDSFSNDVCNGMEATAYHDPGSSRLCLKTDDGHSIVLGDAPGILLLLFGRPFANVRAFGDVCFLPNGNELIFDDHDDLYLMDVNQRKVGWIAHGSRAITVAPRYKRSIYTRQQ